ncbi:S8 family peptidase [Paractinoplanes hotanensis]|uniref:S8 family peptidase n=1 Tax=Paractinoplanes hotanensis TaxID=2906497 RepID=A0ABT0YDA7_9ACTN|nr:S8 family peptidase [Actinoplanes hotanensis]MCM4083775.1 S8 family peptidase [Actinoplanes hotanensis]
MKKHLRRYAVGALAIGAVAGGAAIALPATVTSASEWRPATYNLAEMPEQILPPTVSTQEPVRVVTTSLDAAGKPVIKVTTATSKTAATKAVEAGQSAANAVGVELDAIATATDVPTGSDTYRSQQWDFSKISVAGAWQKSTGAGVTVAVLDTGVAGDHPDLAGNVVAGYDAVANANGGATDPNGHGTHVAGTIAAVTGNGVGISGIAPDAKIMPVRVLGANGSGYMSDTAEGIVWAADHGASVINMSLGSRSKVTAVSNAISYARSKGVVVVAAAGNDRANGSPTNYPAADAGVIGVAATDSADRVGSYSNAGSYVDVAAPGSSILSTYPTALGSKNGYAGMSGTSMASPHVAGVAALLKAAGPTLTPDQVESALETSAVDLGTKGFDNDFGNGRIDAAAALAVVSPATPSPATPNPTTSSPATTVPTTAPTTTVPTTAPTPATPSTSPTPTPTPTTVGPTPTPSKTTSSPAPTPSRTTPAPKVNPVIQVATPSTSVVYGSAATITYTVTAGNAAWARKPVQIGVNATGSSATSWTRFTTDAKGKLSVQIKATAHFQVRLTALATDTSGATTSAVTSFTVRSSATVKSPAARKLTVKTSGPTRKAAVQQYAKNKWVTVRSFTASSGTTTVTRLPSGATVRVVFPATAKVAGLTTATVKIG